MMNIKELSLEEKIGQKFIFGINSNNIDEIVKLIEKYHIGGVILYKKNYSNYDEMLSVIRRLKEANKNNKIPLFIAIDQEGGRVNRMPFEFKNIKNIYDMSKKDMSLISKNGIITGRMLSEMGINMNFAPVLDVCDNDKSKVLYNRCFYGDIDDVSKMGSDYVKELSKKGVISVVKHFPGHGVSTMDSHFITPYVFDNKKIFEKHIKPFENILNNKDVSVDGIMIGHLVIKGMTGGLPASISNEFISEYLRKRYNYDGLIITDEMNMLSRNILYKFSYAKKMFKSLSDLYLIKIKNINDAIKIINKYINFCNKDIECMNMLDDSVDRIIRIKDKYNINDGVDSIGCDIDLINKEIDNINKMCM